MRIFLAFVCCFLVACGSADKRKHARRGAPRRQALSPIGGYVVAAESPDRNKPDRDIVITRPGQKGEILRFPFRQQVDVVWAPDENALAVVDLVLPNEARVVVFALPSGRPLYELRREAICELNPDLPCGTAYSHVFFSNVIWLAPDRIEVTVDMINPLEANLPPRIHGVLQATFPPIPPESK